MVKNLRLKNFSGLLLAAMLCLSMASWGQYSLETTTYSQNFDALPASGSASATGGNLNNVNTSLNGWYFSETGSGGNTTLNAGTGSSNSGDTYSFGLASAADRALGGLQSGSVTPTIGFYIVNNTGSTIANLQVSYSGEQWRLGTTGRVDQLDFQYSTNATSFGTGTWIDQNDLDFVAPLTAGTVGGVNGNTNTTVKTYTFTGINLASGGTIFFRWNDFNATGSDDGLGVDNFSLTATLAAATQAVQPVVTATGSANGTDTFWNTATVSLSTTTTDATIYYTTDGTTPTTASAVYSAPFAITATSTIKAFAVASGLDDSTVVTKAYTVTNPATAALPYSEAFANTLGAWTNFSVTGAKPWLANNNGAYANGYNVAAVESWLVSPKLTGITNTAAISFDYQIPFAGAGLEVLYSTNYDGYSAPSTATWEAVTTIPAAAAVTSFTNTGSLVVPATTNVHIAFKYTGVTNNYSAWYVKNFTASLSAPAVTTTQIVTDVNTITAAASGGTITAAFGTVTHKGVVWGAAANPTTALTTKTDEGTGSAAFTSNLTGLTPNTLYYYRAYAENQNGTAYGTEYSFTTRAYAPGTPAVINPNSATLDVILDENGNNAATKYAIRVNGGIYTNYYVQANGSVNSTEVFQSVTEWGSTTVTVNGLAPETTYTFDVRARNTATALTNYSATASGTTTVSTVPALVLTASSLDFGSICLNSVATGSFSFTGDNISTNATLEVAALNGYSYSSTEGGTYTSTLTIDNFDGSERTVYVHFTPTAAQSYDGTIQVDGQGTDSTAVLDLATIATGINTAGTVNTGTTTGSEVTAASAVLYATSTIGCSAFSAYGFEYSTTSGFSNGTGTVATAGNLNAGAFSASVSGLAPNTTYYYKAYIIDGAGTHYGSQLSFTTASLTAPDATDATDITQTSFTANWVAVEGAGSYRLDVSTLAAFGTGTLATDLFISQYSEGSSNNKYLEIYNGTGHNVNLANYKLDMYANGSATISTSVTLSGTLAHGQVAVYKNGSAVIYTGTATSNLAVNFNGDDTIVLAKTTGEFVDIFGRIGSDPGSAWTATGYSTVDKVLVRKPSVTSGVTINPTNDISGGAAAGFPTLATEWNIFNIDVVSDLGSHTGNFVPSYVSGYDNLMVPGASQAVTGLAPNTQYYYRVRAYSAASTSDNSDVITVLTGPDSVAWVIPSGETAPQWSPAVTPDSTINVVIAADYDTATYGNFTANSLTVNSGYNLTVNPNTTITVYGDVTNNAGVDNVVIEDNGALLQRGTGSNTTAVTVVKNSNPLFRFDYTLWSAPVESQTLKSFSTATATNRFYQYDYASNGTTNVEGYWPVNPLTTSFEPGKSFLIRMPNILSANVTGTTNDGVTTPAEYLVGTDNYYFEGVFKGVPNTDTVTYPLSTEGNRYTATGNPYPSPINLADFYAANSTVIDQSGALYFWRKKNESGTGSYATLTLADFNPNEDGSNSGAATGGQDNEQYFTTGNEANWAIAPGQGFLVQTDATAPANPVVTYTNEMRQAAPATGGQAFFKTGISQVSRLRMKVTTTAGGFSQMSVVYMPQGTLGLDYGYDGKKLTEAGQIALYTVAQNTPLAIQARPAFDATDVVPVGFTATTAGSYTIALSHTEGAFANGQKIYLKDKAEGIIGDMGQGDYTFTSEAGTFESRFEVLYTTTALGTDIPALDANTVIVYQNNGAININSGLALMSTINVFDIGGRKLYTADKVNTTEAAITNLTAAQQILIVEINTDKGTVTKKIVF